jgi:quercetin dioxygenase-like cupin family protein
MTDHKHLSKLLYAASAALMLLACSDRPTEPKSTSSGGNGGSGTEPSFTDPVAFVGTAVGRGNLGTFHSQSKANGYDVELKSHDNTDIVVATIGVASGGNSGWHFHPGPVLVIVKVGTITFYHADDPSCTPTQYGVGSAFIEEGGAVGMARNETQGADTVVATFFAPAGSATRLDAPKPANCPF